MRPFHYEQAFAAGQHRGVDLGAPAGARVVAPCSGRVAYIGASPNGRAISLLCGTSRVTVLPVAGVAVVRGAAVRAGAPMAVVGAGAGHPGLHLSLRDAANRLAYRDPAPRLAQSAPPLGAAPPPATRSRRWRPLRPALPVAAEPGAADATPAPWPAWLGVAVVCVAAAGLRGRRGNRHGHAPDRHPVGQAQTGGVASRA